ncbi:hypothetical protein [Ferrovum myxofaciens]|uniref:hypothetical protein n=1 Tax=Ferrovum myxofaciens TaxID=416213 RepID=UPI002352D527|nr:hypothetical protein [Ferrovum myxofaciens]MBU6995879.1 hypothetical protein [Ferrovum myxofaciens]
MKTDYNYPPISLTKLLLFSRHQTGEIISLSFDLSAEESVRAKQLIGRRLLCEIPFGQDDIERLRQALLPEGIQAWSCPTLASMMTVGIGVYYYNQGDFWSEFPGLDSPVDRSSWGQKFEDFIVKHDSLENFRSIKNEGGHRYVGPMLAHGGIPQTCLSDFFSLITHYGDREQSGQGLIDDLKRSPERLAQTDRPVQRFLKYGGEVSEEFVSRFLALWQCYERGDMGAKCGLPDRVVEEFSGWWPKHRPKRRDHFKRMPRPDLRIEPAGLGVFLHLPRCDDHPDIDPKARWHALGKDWAVTRTHEVAIVPSDTWKITGVGQPYALEGPTDELPGLFFDPNTGKVISEPSLRRLPDKVWALFRGRPQFEPPPSYEEEFRQWPGYYLAFFDLSDSTQLRVGNHTFDVRRPFFHCDSDPTVQGVLTRDGVSVFHAIPRIQWEGKANLYLTKDKIPQGNIDIESGGLAVLLDKSGEYDIELRGPLGESIRRHFVLVPGLSVVPSPKVMWPKQSLINWDLSVDAGRIKSRDTFPPFTRYDSSLEFKVEYVGYKIELYAEVPRLNWRLLPRQEGQMTEWFNEPMLVWLDDLYQNNYPLLECTFGSTEQDTEVFLVGKHSLGKLKARQQRSGEKNSWYFDLRAVRDELEATGKSEEFDLQIQSRYGAAHFRGKTLSVRPHWHLQNYQARWKKEGDQHVIHVSWHESGKSVTGRWLVVIPLWRPWVGAVLQHQFVDSERNEYEWRIPLSDLQSGRYIVKAVHAPWGCDDWFEAHAACKQAINVYPEQWPDFFGEQRTAPTVDFYFQALLAHWYRPERVRQPPQPPSGLTADEIKRFLDSLRLADMLERINIPTDGTGSLNIFCANARATTQAFASLSSQALADICRHVLPNQEIITLELTENDKCFVREVAFQYTTLRSAARSIRLAHRRRVLSGVLAKWHKNLSKEFPPVDEVIFLCEKFRIFEDQSGVRKREYEQLKFEYQNREAV